MTTPVSPAISLDRPAAGIVFVVVGLLAISVNDMLIKQLSGGYPLHQMIFIRSSIGIVFSLVIVQFEGGWSILKTRTPGLHLLRAALIVVANLTYFAALAAIPLADATALFMVAPLMITLLSIPLLGEKVGPLRLGAVVAGMAGAVVMMQPWQGEEERTASLLVMSLPVWAALAYALNQILTRKLGGTSRASAMAVYIQAMFMLVGALFFAIAGDGDFVDASSNPSTVFLLRAWVWPHGNDVWLFLMLGFNAAIVGYTLSQAYRLANAATIAPFEYLSLPLAVMWGWVMWRDFPAPAVWAGTAMIVAASLFVFLRERHKSKTLVSQKRVHRRY